jgi:hypothetical protein
MYLASWKYAPECVRTKTPDPSRVTIEDVCWFVDNPGIFVWETGGKIVGFSAADPRNGNIFALFVEVD